MNKIESLDNSTKYLQKRAEFLTFSIFQESRGFQNIVLEQDDKDCLVLSFTTSQNKPGYIAFAGRKQKPSAFYHYSTEESRNESMQKFINLNAKTKEQKQAIKQEHSNGHKDVKIGDIFGSSWGYSMTLVDFYQVIDKIGKSTLVLQSIQQSRTEEGFMSGRTSPVPNAFIGEPFRKRYNPRYKSVKIHESSSARLIEKVIIAGVEQVPSFYYNNAD